MRVAAHAHGPFLTSVDRTAVRDDDAWNAACLAVAPELIARYCEWVAAQPFASAAEVSAAHAIVAGALRDGAASAAPKPAAKGKGKGKGRGKGKGGRGYGGRQGGRGRGGRGGRYRAPPSPSPPPPLPSRYPTLLCSILGAPISAAPLLARLRDAKVVPVWAPTDEDICAAPEDREVRFVRAADAVRVPPAFVRRLSPAFIKRWLGGRLPLLATPLEPLFARLSVAELETARRPGRLAPLFRDAGESAPALNAQLVAAFAEAAEEEAAAQQQALVDAQRAKQRENKQKQREKQKLKTSGTSAAAAAGGGERAGSGASAARGSDSASALPPARLPSDWKQWPVVLTTTGSLAPAARLCVPEEAFDLLPPTLQAALIRCATSAAPHPDLLVAARALGVPAALDELARRLFAARPPPPAAIVFELTAWAQRRNEPSIVSAVLLEGSNRLVPVGAAHLGSALGGAALEMLGLPCVASAYGPGARNFLERAGVRATVGLVFSR